MFVTNSFPLQHDMSDRGHPLDKPISMFSYIKLLLVTNRLPIIAFFIWDDRFLRWSIKNNTECAQISKISTPPKIHIKMIKIPLIVLLVASGIAVEYNVTFLFEVLCSIVTEKEYFCIYSKIFMFYYSFSCDIFYI